jgi:hypothetical protein
VRAFQLRHAVRLLSLTLLYLLNDHTVTDRQQFHHSFGCFTTSVLQLAKSAIYRVGLGRVVREVR